MQNELTPAEALWQEVEWRKCANNATYFVQTYGKMWTKEGGDPIDWNLWDCQSDALDQFQQFRLLIMLKTRQLGMSWTACGYALWKLLFTKNAHVYFQSIGQKEVAEQVERIKFIYEWLPEWMRTRVELGGRNRKSNESLVQFSNGSALHAVSTTKRAGHGAAPTLYILDEFGRNEQDTMTWRAVKPSLASKGQVIVISTANGIGNKYHELWVGASTAANSLHPIFYPASAHPEYTPEFLAREKEDYAGDLVGYYEAYPSTPEEAFMSSSRCPFNSERITESLNHVSSNGIKPEVGRLIHDKDGKVVFEADPKGSLCIWKHPLTGALDAKGKSTPKHYYGIGADVAEGLVNGDYSVASVLDDDTGEVVALYRIKIAPEYYAHQLKMLGEFYGNAFIAVEVNVNSDLILDDLKTAYAWLYTRERRERIYDIPTLEVGFRTTSSSKPRIILQMRRYFDSKEKPLKIYSTVILHEMSSFEEDDRGRLRASGNKFDDTVMATAIAIECCAYIPKRSLDYTPTHRTLGGRSL
jgi:hypothetical protein